MFVSGKLAEILALSEGYELSRMAELNQQSVQDDYDQEA